jgi:hypothetical protein
LLERRASGGIALPVIVLVAGAALSLAADPVDEPDPVQSLIPSAELLPGWSRPESVTMYGSDTLYEYIDGAARMYHDFGFRSLAHARFTPEGEPGVFIDFDVYRMKDDLGAYGIYSNTRPPDAKTDSWGVEGYLRDDAAAAWKGPFYVHAATENAGPGTAAAMKRLVSGVASAIPGETAAPRLLQVFPEENRLANRDRYVARDLLGYFFLPGGFLVDYQVDGQELRLFLIETSSEDTALAAWSNFRETERREGRNTQKQTGIGDAGFRAVEPGLGPGIVVRSGRYVAGVWGGEEDRTAAVELLKKLVANLSTTEVPDGTSEPEKH